MDGLECSEVMISEIPKWNPIYRLDAEFFDKKAMKIENDIRSRDYFSINSNEIVSGPFGSSLKSSAYLEKGDVPFIRIENIRGGFFINRNNMIYISKKDNGQIKNSELRTDDIILSKVGNTIGFFAGVDDEISLCNISENNIGIKTAKYSQTLKKYMLVYLNTKHAQKLVHRRTSGNAQPKLNVGDMASIPIPMFSESFYGAMQFLVESSALLIKRSGQKYIEANEILETTIGVFASQTSASAIKQLSKSFNITGRLDAEYYQPNYDEIAEKLNTKETVQSLCNLYDGNYLPKNQKYKYIELANVGDSGEITNVETYDGIDLPTRARRIVKAGQIIVSSIEGSLPSCARITDEYNDALCSTGFYVIDSDYINPETLLVLFKSEPMQALMKQRCSGTILTAINKDEFLSMPLPMIDKDIQKEIAAKVQESFALRKQSKLLIEYAKQAVEMAIEQGEETANRWLDSKMKEENYGG